MLLERLGASRRSVRASWGDFVMSWGALGTSLGALGALLGRPWRRLVASCGVLGLSWDRLGSSRAAPVTFLGPPRLDFPCVLANRPTTEIIEKRCFYVYFGDSGVSWPRLGLLWSLF